MIGYYYLKYLLTASDFQAWFLVYWASTRWGDSLDRYTSASLSELVRDPLKNKYECKLLIIHAYRDTNVIVDNELLT